MVLGLYLLVSIKFQQCVLVAEVQDQHQHQLVGVMVVAGKIPHLLLMQEAIVAVSGLFGAQEDLIPVVLHKLIRNNNVICKH